MEIYKNQKKKKITQKLQQKQKQEQQQLFKIQLHTIKSSLPTIRNQPYLPSITTITTTNC